MCFSIQCRGILASTRLPFDSVCLLLPLSSVSQGSFSFYRLSTYLGLSLRGIPHFMAGFVTYFSRLCPVFRFLFDFRRYCVVAICPFLYFYWARLVLRFTLFADRSAVVHFFLDPSQFLSSVFMRSYCRLRQLCWDCFHT